MVRNFINGTQCKERSMSDFKSYRKEKAQFYLKTLEILTRKYPDKTIEYISEHAVGISNEVWSDFSIGLHPEFQDEIRIGQNLGNPMPTDYERYQAYFKTMAPK
jgi:hypothetical protein